MSKLITNTIRHTGGSADNITLDNSQNVTVEGNATVDGTSTLTGNVTASGQATVAGLVGVGATSPNSKIHTLGSDATNTRINVQSTSATVDPAIQFTNSGNTGAFNDVAHITTDIVNGNAQGCLIFKTRSADGAGNDAAERVRIQSGGGISFNGDTAAANALDDYEEGTYNPTWAGITNFGSGYNDWYYTKIGRVVNVLGTLRVNTTTNDGTDVSFTLPFTPKAQSGNTLNISVGTTMHNNVETGSNGLVTYVYGGNAYGYFYNNVEDGSWWILEGQHLSADDTIYVNFTYLT